MTQDQPAFIARNSPWRMALILLGCIGFVLIGLWMLGLLGASPDSRRWSGEFVTIIGWIAVLFFGGIGVLVAKTLLLGERVAFRIDASGITDNRFGTESYDWDEITAVQPTRVGNSLFLCFDVTQERFDQIGLIKSRLALANQSLTGLPLSLNLTGTDVSMDGVVAALDQFAPSRLTHSL